MVLSFMVEFFNLRTCKFQADNLSVNELAYKVLRAEASVNNMRCVIRQNIGKCREKALQLSEDHPKLKWKDARSDTENLCKELPRPF